MNKQKGGVAESRLEDFVGLYDSPEAAKFIAATLDKQLSLKIESRKVIRWIRFGLAESELD
jgi:hypothetical protein